MEKSTMEIARKLLEVRDDGSSMQTVPFNFDNVLQLASALLEAEEVIKFYGATYHYAQPVSYDCGDKARAYLTKHSGREGL